ncbi:slit 1 protein [Trichonephila inaurata madagascariensis]|uniref:Slit 1 protein n=1 Tax=Trichonephila inaurata madagascariensis TaxID=2747483 RepID=A0A8X6IWW6_9ARAC|nr:slit 1 protein [Trichonephila inaurata madagascariensis]
MEKNTPRREFSEKRDLYTTQISAGVIRMWKSLKCTTKSLFDFQNILLTLGGFLGGAVIVQNLKGSLRIIVLFFYFICLWNQAVGLCPARCECNDEILRVLCDSANLDVVPITLNPELRELRLSNNHIKAIRTSFSVYRNLEFLDVSHNQLPILDKDNFVDLKELKVLLVNSNMISLLQNDTFRGLLSLKVLHLNENYLQALPAKCFVQLENLELLDLCQNSISSIDQEAFFGLKNLKTLLLRDNKLTHIPSTPFQYISKLFKLDLGLNSFENIPENSFSALNDLEELSLDGCGVKVIMYGAFKWLNSLLILRIHDNELWEVPTKALFDVIRLEELHIGQNKFQSLKAKSFQRLKFLRTIEINGCPNLSEIEKGAFSDNSNLKTIVINHNKELKHIQDGAFDNLPNVQHASFRGNSFETLQYGLLPWDELQFLDVRDNPFVCNCSLVWLWKLLMTKNFSSFEGQADTTQVICVNPPGLKDRALGNLPHDDLDCYSLESRRQLIIGLVSGGALFLAVIILLGFRYREKLAGVLKTKWGRGRKEPQYQKTSAEEESTILQAGQQSLKMTPVTEL